MSGFGQHPVHSGKVPKQGAVRRDKSTILWRISFALPILFLALITPVRKADLSLWRRASFLAENAYALCTPDADNIYTVDANNTKTQCIVVRGALIVDTGSIHDISQRWKNGAFGFLRAPLEVRYTNRGAIVLPGLSDSHAHILEYGASRLLPLEGTKTIQETVARVREYIQSNSDVLRDKNRYILGGGWDHTVWPSSDWPSAADLDLDPVIAGRPVILQSKDCHALWISSRALEASLPFPDEVDGGVIVRNASGYPTGMLLDNAQELVKQPELTHSDLLERFHVTVRDALSMGITSIHDAGLDPVSLNFFNKYTENETLPLRIYAMSFFDENTEYWGNTTKPIHLQPGKRLAARSVKIFADGALRTGGAALFGPYHDHPSTNGFMRIDPEVLFRVIPFFLRDGWQVNVHAIGDRANSIVIDAFEASLAGANVTTLRPRLEHAQIIAKKDMERLGKLGVIASVQPTHAISDMWYAEDRLGPERVRDLYAFRNVIDNGVRITLGSDAPVESINPLSGFYAAVTRLAHDGSSPHGPAGWFPEQRLTRLEALRGITIDPAYASFTESVLGSLEPGKIADYVVLSQDIMVVPEDQLLATMVTATVIDGAVVFGQI